MWIIVLKQDVSFGLTFDLIDANLGLLFEQGLLEESKRSSREAVQRLEKKNRDLTQTLQSVQCDLERTLKREQVRESEVRTLFVRVNKLTF